jgi:hypothetical protein
MSLLGKTSVSRALLQSFVYTRLQPLEILLPVVPVGRRKHVHISKVKIMKFINYFLKCFCYTMEI